MLDEEGTEMKTYEVLLTRSFRVEIDAQDEKDARFLAEFYIGGEKDLSNAREKAEHTFRINEIEMTVNEATESSQFNNG